MVDGGTGDLAGAADGTVMTPWLVDPFYAGQTMQVVATDLTTGDTATQVITDSPDLVFTLNMTFNGTAPTSTPPWLTATFHTVATGDVTLTLHASLNVVSEFMSEVAFNVDPTITPSGLTIAQTGGALVAPVTAILEGADNAQTPPGFGPVKGFDVELDWATAAGVNRFDGTDTVTLDITGTGISASSFNFTNSSGTPEHVAAHFQGIPVPGDGTTSGAIGDGGTPPPVGQALLSIDKVTTTSPRRALRAMALPSWRASRFRGPTPSRTLAPPTCSSPASWSPTAMASRSPDRVATMVTGFCSSARPGYIRPPGRRSLVPTATSARTPAREPTAMAAPRRD